MTYQKHGAVLAAQGYDTTPVKGKVPMLPGWQKRIEAAQDFDNVEYAEASIGVVTGGKHHLIAADIDVKDAGAAAQIRELCLDILGAAPERIGAAPKTMFIYRLSEPPGKKRKTAVYGIEGAGEKNCVEILAEGQQFVASGIHPDTKQRYKWPQDSLMDYQADELPVVSIDDVSEFLAAAGTVLSDHGELISKSLSNGNGALRNGLDFSSHPQQAEYERIVAAMAHVDNTDLHYDDWVYMGHAVKGALGDNALARGLFHQFSEKSVKYESMETDRLWKSIGEVKKIGAGTIFHHAAQGGYVVGEATNSGVELTPPPAAATDVFRSWQPTDANDIPARDFIFGTHYIRKFVSGTVAQGGVGKSTLALFEAIVMAARLIEYGCKDSDLVVAYYNAEDPLDEIKRRVVAICQHAHINQRDLVDRLFIASGRDAGVVLAEGELGTINEKVFDFLGDMIDQTGADVLLLDPLANMTTSPETNEVFRLLGARLSALADEKNISIEIIHHTRKLQSGGEANHEDARGGGALVNGMRSVRVLNNMTPAEGHKAGLETHVDHFRVDDGKANLARRSERAAWWRKVSVELANGDHVAAIEPWQWPDFSDHFTAVEISRALDLMAVERDGMKRRAYPTSEGWGGEIVCGVKADGLENIDAVEAAAWREAAATKDAKARSPLANQYHAATKTLLADLGNSGYLEIMTAQDKKGHDRKCLQRTEKYYEIIGQSGD